MPVTIKKRLDDKNLHIAASVFNPLTAAMAQDTGFDCAVVGGSVMAASKHLTPDVGLLTLSELVEGVYRIASHSELPLIVDGDSGYGNALNAQRLVKDLERAGASAVTIEDTVLPYRYGNRSGLCDTQEQQDKLAAAVEARRSNDYSIIARTRFLASESPNALQARVAAYSSTGVDALCLFGDVDAEGLANIKAVTDLPLMVISYNAGETEQALYRSQGVSILLNGHHAFEASVVAMMQCYQRLAGQPVSQETGKALLKKYTQAAQCEAFAKRYVGL